MDDAYMEAIEPYRYEDAVSFQTAYLSGFLADKYDVDSDASQPRANERIKSSVEDAFASTAIGYSASTVKSSVSTSKSKVSYALMPVWMLNTKYKGKIYTFAMNGQTGKFIGALPVSWGKFWGMFIGAFLGLSTVGCLIASLLL
jgi:hypothetical protein